MTIFPRVLTHAGPDIPEVSGQGILCIYLKNANSEHLLICIYRGTNVIYFCCHLQALISFMALFNHFYLIIGMSLIMILGLILFMIIDMTSILGFILLQMKIDHGWKCRARCSVIIGIL